MPQSDGTTDLTRNRTPIHDPTGQSVDNSGGFVIYLCRQTGKAANQDPYDIAGTVRSRVRRPIDPTFANLADLMDARSPRVGGFRSERLAPADDSHTRQQL
jgi:hypothetical protein